MAIRSDGVLKHDRLLHVAMEVFAKKGFHDATVAEICEAAEANIAAVNYHFGGKEQLYAEVWALAFADAHRTYPVDGGLPATAPATQRLRAVIHSLLSRILRHGPHSHAGLILLQEMARPVEGIRQVRRQAIALVRKHLELTVRELLGPKVSDQSVRLCVMSVVNQCLTIGFRGGQKPPSLGEGPFTEQEIDELIEHVHRFSLGGIRAVRRQETALCGAT